MFSHQITRFSTFFDAPVLAWPLALFRILITTHTLLHALSVRADFVNLYGSQGYVRTAIHEIFLWDITLTFTALRGLLNGPNELSYLAVVGVVYGLSLVGLAVGFLTRPMAVVAWLLHLLLLKSTYLFDYGVDYFATMALFVCIVAPVGRVWSVDSWRRRAAPEPVSIFYQRFLQLTLCCVYFFAGFGKAAGSDWRTGDAVWLALQKTDFQAVSLDALRPFTAFWTIVGWLVLLLELGYAALIWHRRLGPAWLLGIVAMHAGIAGLMNLPWFGTLLIIFNICAFPGHLARYGQWLNRPAHPHSSLTSNQSSLDEIIHDVARPNAVADRRGSGADYRHAH
jgi:hypothetical protein